MADDKIVINLAWLMKLLEAVFAILNRLLPSISSSRKKRDNRNSNDSHRSDHNNPNNAARGDNVGNEDPFEILGLTGGKENTTIEEATKARRKLALKWHPDRNVGNVEEATKKIQQINDAFVQVEKNLAGEGDDHNPHYGEDVAENDDERVESEDINHREQEYAEELERQCREAREFAEKVEEEIANFEKAQRNALRGIYESSPFATASAASSKRNIGERGRRKAARKRAEEMKDGSYWSN